MITDKQKDQIKDLIDHSILPAITDDMNIEYGSKEEEEALDYLIKELKKQRQQL